MELLRLTVGPFYTNCYIVVCGKDAIVVDPGGDFDKIDEIMKSRNLTPKIVLLTHGHFDHCNACKPLQDQGAKVYLHSMDNELIQTDKNLAAKHGFVFHAFSPDFLIEDGQSLELCGCVFKVLHTPGHTPGSVCFFLENYIFSGDTLFYMSIGRTDTPFETNQILDSLHNKLFKSEGEFTVYPGHDSATSLSFEKKNNPYA